LQEPLHELGELAASAGASILGQMISVRSKPVAATYIGKGKVEELAAMVAQHDAALAIFDHALSPIQERNLQRLIGCRVLDRAGLILDIFAQRATSSEGKLQVELAQLKHLSTRLVRGWTHLERQKGGIGLRGPGETQLETDRRLIGMRIKTLTRRLNKVEAQRSLRRRARHRTPIPTISLVGYTNAGKSSLFNALTGAGVFAANQLFATLDPTMRRLELPGFGPVVLSDTVGFVRDLPHSLIAAFHSTLEEVSTSSCLLLVNDFSDLEHSELKLEVERVLAEIDADDVPCILVNNKIDLLDEPARSATDGEGRINRVWLSAESGEGLDLLRGALATLLGEQHQQKRLRLAPGAGALRASLYQRCDVIEESYDEHGHILLTLRMDQADFGWLKSQRQSKSLWQEILVSEHDQSEAFEKVLSRSAL
jgi:GTP-binding protein HflX